MDHENYFGNSRNCNSYFNSYTFPLCALASIQTLAVVYYLSRMSFSRTRESRVKINETGSPIKSGMTSFKYGFENPTNFRWACLSHEEKTFVKARSYNN